jgi:hypothetical protein
MGVIFEWDAAVEKWNLYVLWFYSITPNKVIFSSAAEMT